MAKDLKKTFEEFMYEIHILTPLPKKKQTSTNSTPKPKSDPYGEDPEAMVKRIKQKTQKESILHATRAAAADAANQQRKQQKYTQKPLRPGEVKKYDPKTKTYVSNLSPAPASTQQQPLRRGEVRTFNKTTGKWESNLR
jgi:hypothetical protein